MSLQKLLFCLFIMYQGVYAQKEDALFQAIQEYDVKALSEIIDHNQLLDGYLWELSKVYRSYLLTGEEEKVEVDKALQTPQRLFIYTHYQRLTRKGYDPKIHEALLEEIVKSKSIFLQNEMYLSLIQYLNSFTQKEPFLIALLKDYLTQVDTNLLTKVNNYIFQKIVLDLELKNSEINKIMKPNFQLWKKIMLLDSLCPDIAFHKANLEQGKAIYTMEFEKNTEAAMKYLKKASVFYDMVPYHFGKQQHTFNQNSLGILLRNSGKYDDAIKIFNSLLISPFITKNPTALLKVHTSLEKCYAQLDNSKKAHYHAQIKNKLQDSIYYLKQTEQILDKDYEQKKEQFSNRYNSLNTQFQTLIPIAACLLLLVLLFTWLYKKTQSKKVKLESEKEDTLKEVRALTQLVIKNHIILKDKTKVYINDLMYIKAEDHYIRVFTSNGKNHLVRGRLSDLDEQLPPNFIRTHRSYITNRNFVKQISKTILLLLDGSTIPISRKFKDLLP